MRDIVEKMNKLCESGWDKESLLNIVKVYHISKEDLKCFGSKNLLIKFGLIKKEKSKKSKSTNIIDVLNGVEFEFDNLYEKYYIQICKDLLEKKWI